MDKDGNVRAQSGGISVTAAVSSGMYKVDFGSSVKNNALSVTNIALPGDQNAERGAPYYELCDGANIGVNCPGDPNDGRIVFVVTTNLMGAPEAHSFNVAAF